MAIINTSDDNFSKDVLSASGLTLVDFWAGWCGPCLRIAPLLKEIAEEGVATVCKLDVTENQNTTAEYDIKGLPTLLLFKDGQLVGRKVGALSKAQMVEFIETESK